MLELQHLADFAETLAALGIFGGVVVVVLKFGRFAGKIEQSVDHMSKSLDATNTAICAFRKKNDQDHDKIHDRIDKIWDEAKSIK
jgi:hypothetical protein